MTGFDDFGKLERDLTAAPKEAIPNIAKAVGISAGKGKRAWQADAKRHRMTPGYAASIDYDTAKLVDGVIETEIGPNLDRNVGTPGFGILEDSPGGVNGAPRRSYVAAEKAIEDDIDQGIALAIDQALREFGL